MFTLVVSPDVNTVPLHSEISVVILSDVEFVFVPRGLHVGASDIDASELLYATGTSSQRVACPIAKLAGQAGTPPDSARD